jgi:hypothetical protein
MVKNAPFTIICKSIAQTLPIAMLYCKVDDPAKDAIMDDANCDTFLP